MTNETTESTKTTKGRHPLIWVPSLYFAQGLPFAVVVILSSVMYKKMGVSNEEVAYWPNFLGLAWAFKPLWSPFLELAGSKKKVVVAFQIICGACLVACASVLQLSNYFVLSLVLFGLVAYSSATHDIAADGSYIANLSKQQQAMYSGWLGAFWNGGKLFVQGGLIVLAGHLEKTIGIAGAWSTVLLILGALLVALGFYHTWAMPTPAVVKRAELTARVVAATTKDVIIEFFKKPGIWWAICFIILFRAGEGQVQTMGRLFLLDPVSAGGLGLTTEQLGIAYGTVATLAFIVGSILGGYFAAWLGLKRSMFIMILAMNVPNLTFLYLNVFHPTDMVTISTVLSVEMLGYGAGFPALMLYIMQVVAPGKYSTAHYALGTGIMQLGFILFSMMSGKIEAWLGYHDFFIWCVLSAIPVLVMSLIVPIPSKEEILARKTPEASDAEAKPA